MNSSTESDELFLKGITGVADLVGSTMGYCGNNVTVCGDARPLTVNDGARVIGLYSPNNMQEYEGVRRVRNASEATRLRAGDGTSTTAVLLAALVQLGRREAEGSLRNFVARGMRDFCLGAISQLESRAVKIDLKSEEGQKWLLGVVSVAMHGDEENAAKVAGLIGSLGQAGSVSIEYAPGAKEIETERIEGYVWPVGVHDASFLDDERTQGRGVMIRRENVMVLVMADPATDVEHITPAAEIWEQECRSQQRAVPLVIICPELSGSARSWLVRREGPGGRKMPVMVVKTPENNTRDWLRDISKICGAKVFDRVNGQPIEKIRSATEFGTAGAVVAHMGRTVFLDCPGHKITRTDLMVLADGRAVDQPVSEANTLADEIGRLMLGKSGDEEQALRQRLAAITGGVGVLRIPMVTDGQLGNAKEVYEDAYMAAFSAIDGGVLPGGGFALSRLCVAITTVAWFWTDDRHKYVQSLSDKQAASYNKGVDTARNALMRPMEVIINQNGEVTFDPVIPSDYWQVFNLATNKWENALDSGILDSLTVLREAVRNAMEESILLVSTKKFLYDEQLQHS